MINVVLPKPHPKPIVVEVFISRLFKGKGRIVASCVAHPGNHHLPKGWVDVEKERSGEDFLQISLILQNIFRVSVTLY